MSYTSQGRRPSRYKEKEDDRWDHSRTYSSSSASDDFDYRPSRPSVFKSPRFKRFLLFATVFFLLSFGAYQRIYLPWLKAQMAEVQEKQTALELEAEDRAVEQSARAGPIIGDQTAHHSVDFDRVVLIQEMDEKHKPAVVGKHDDASKAGRLIVIGDVHGMKEELVKLLDKVNFDKKRDHLVFTGDLISKGPDSAGVVELAMEVGADAVRGNHEDRVLLAYDNMAARMNSLAPATVATDPAEREEELKNMEIFTHNGEYKDRVLARKFNAEQIAWLKRLPIILKVGQIEGLGEVLVVHGGLVPGLKLEKQDPYSVMNMRTIDLKTHVPSDVHVGTVWTKLWNAFQKLQPEHQRSTIIYGHDSKRGLQIEAYSKGLDSSCLKGGKLTAFVIEGGDKKVKERIVQVNCKDKNPKK